MPQSRLKSQHRPDPLGSVITAIAGPFEFTWLVPVDTVAAAVEGSIVSSLTLSLSLLATKQNDFVQSWCPRSQMCQKRQRYQNRRRLLKSSFHYRKRAASCRVRAPN